MSGPSTRSKTPNKVPNSVPKATIGGRKSLAHLKNVLRPEHFLVKEKQSQPSVEIPWKAFLVTSKIVEKQLKDHEDNRFELLTPLGIALALTNPSIFVYGDMKLVLGQFLVLQLSEIANPKPKVTFIKAKDWPHGSDICKNRNVHIGDEILGTVVRHLASPGDLLLITNPTKFCPEDDENFGLALLQNQFERIAQSVIVFKRGENATLSPFTMPNLPSNLNLAERLTMSKYGQTVFMVKLPDPDSEPEPKPKFEIATKLITPKKKKPRMSLML